ncbi:MULTISPECIES: hypothetical protein [Pyrobaculum]|uniref:CARDB domain-containing protein n=2 Tax=Pyrobaculum aerophilum TaxID=13773 RepID=Q8ZSN2_PYRAE|nr:MULTISPECIES: hypothetical protein [Pyrobaculum]AAL65081.1 conserved hypothetical protein [Pyrobaculum aerophilum str. IM2]HII47790.1 hypothetical protein [Pyrobaculum aerophilum]
MKWTITALVISMALAALAYSQATVGLTPSVDYLWLGAKWSQVPKYPGDIGVLTLSYYLSNQYVDVSVYIDPKCPYLTPLETARLPSAGPGVVTVALKVSVSALNVTCPVNVVFHATYKAAGSSLTDGMEKVEYAEIYIPPYPTAEVSARGVAYIGLPSAITLIVKSPYLLMASLSVQGQGARVLSPTGQYAVNSTYAEIPVILIADTYSASLLVTIQARDWLGNPVALTYAVPVAAAPTPPPVLYISPTTLYLNKYNRVNLTIQLPVAADGLAVVTASGAVMPQSSITIPIKNGRGSGQVEVYPVANAVVFTAQVTYQTSGVSKTDQISATVSVQQTVGGIAKVVVKPSRLIAGVTNNVTLIASAPGPFNVSVTVSNAAVDKPQPFYFGGADTASASLLITPLSNQPVTIAVSIYHSAGVDQYTINLPVTSSSIYTVIPTPSIVKSGGNRTVIVTVINSGDVAVQKAVVTISPASGNVLASTYTFQISRLAPLDSVQLPISFIVPATYSGTIAFTYNIVYTTELGTTSSAQGTFYLQSLQTPVVNITSVTVVPTVPEPRRTFYISLTVVNKGFASVSNLQVEAKLPRGIRPVTSPIYFAGQLDSQQTATIPLSFNATAPGQYQIELTISYTDQYGNYYTIPYTVTINVANGTRFLGPGGRPTTAPQVGASNFGQTWTYAAAAVAVIIAVISALYLTRRRKLKS